jgi:hypothetical protein
VIGAPGSLETVNIVTVDGQPGGNLTLTITPALRKNHVASEPFVEPGTGLELAAPLKFDHAANLPFSVRGTGISFTPATRFAHSSNEPVRPAGSGIVLDRPLARAHDTDAVVRVDGVTTAGFQGKPDQWFGGPELSPEAGSMVLRDGAGQVVDSLNYGAIVDPWMSGGFRGAAGNSASCQAGAPGVPIVRTGHLPLPGIPFSGLVARIDASQGSTGRYPDGQDSDLDCVDFMTSFAGRIAAVTQGATGVKVVTVTQFTPGQSVVIDAGADAETLTIATVGSPGLTRASVRAEKGDTFVRVDDHRQFTVGQVIVVGSGADEEQGIVAAVDTAWRAGKLTLKAPLAYAHEAGAIVSGTGIAFTTPVTKPHPAGALMMGTGDLATPGSPNKFVRRGL